MSKQQTKNILKSIKYKGMNKNQISNSRLSSKQEVEINKQYSTTSGYTGYIRRYINPIKNTAHRISFINDKSGHGAIETSSTSQYPNHRLYYSSNDIIHYRVGDDNKFREKYRTSTNVWKGASHKGGNTDTYTNKHGIETDFYKILLDSKKKRYN